MYICGVHMRARVRTHTHTHTHNEIKPRKRNFLINSIRLVSQITRLAISEKKKNFWSALNPDEFSGKVKKAFLFLVPVPVMPSSRTARERNEEEGRGGKGNGKRREGMEAKRE